LGQREEEKNSSATKVVSPFSAGIGTPPAIWTKDGEKVRRRAEAGLLWMAWLKYPNV
jgi:hypothetical protein